MLVRNQVQIKTDNFLAWLRNMQSRIAQLEQQARIELKKDNKDQYIALLRSRAELIADLAEQAKDFHPDLPAPVQSKAANALHSFSRSAQFSLELDSPFYMSALLFRDDHLPGEPDNLEVLILELAMEDTNNDV